MDAKVRNDDWIEVNINIVSPQMETVKDSRLSTDTSFIFILSAFQFQN